MNELIDRPADELTPEELERALAELPKPVICAKCGTELRRPRGRHVGIRWDHVEQVRGHKGVPADDAPIFPREDGAR